MMAAFPARTAAGADSLRSPGPLYGTEVAEGFITGMTDVADVVVNDTYIYWTSHASQSVGRANLDDTGVSQTLMKTDAIPDGMAIDGSHIYWTGIDAGTIGRANLDGTGLNQAFITGANSPTGIKVDWAHIYWSQAGPPGGPPGSTIGRANLDGTGVNQSFITWASVPAGLAIQQP